MARSHGRVLATIWEDEDFLALTEQQQRLYLFLISQQNLNHAGLLPITLRRWARKAAGLTAADVEKHLRALADARFLVVDEETEELLIRSFVRNDGVWKQPRVMGAMVSGALEIESRELRAALLEEVERIPLDDLSDKPTKQGGAEGPSIRQQVADHIDTLRKTLGPSTPPPSGRGSGTPSAPPSESPSTPREVPEQSDKHADTRVNWENAREEPPSDPPAEAPAEGDDYPLDSCARTRAPRAHSPTPVPCPQPPLRGGAREDDSEATTQGLPAQRPDGRPTSNAPIDDDGFELTDAMRRWAATHTPGLDPDYETAQFLDHHRAEGRRRSNWPAEWQKWMRRSAKWASERRRQALPAAGAENVVALNGRRPSTADQRAAAAFALAEQLRAQEETS